MQNIIKKLIPLATLAILLYSSFSYAGLVSKIITTEQSISISNTSQKLNAKASIESNNSVPTVASIKFKYTTLNTGSSNCNNLPGAITVQGTPNPVPASGTIDITAILTGLTPGTIYHYCAIDQTVPGSPVYGGIVSFQTTGTPPAAPGTLGTATTEGNNVTSKTTATIKGSVTFPSGFSGTNGAWFRYSHIEPQSCNDTFGTQTSPITVSPGNNQNFQAEITGLSPGTKYFYCAIVGNSTFGSTQFSFGQVNFFNTPGTTPPPPPPTPEQTIGEVITLPTVFNVSDVEATFAGRLVSGEGTLFGYFRYSDVEIPPIFCNDIYGSDMKSAKSLKPHLNGQVVPGGFITRVTDLEPDTQYAFCAVVSNHAKSPTQIGYGKPVVFRTLPCQTCPHTTIKTNPAEVLTSTSAYLKGNYGSTKNNTTYFEYVEVPKDLATVTPIWIRTPQENHKGPSYQNIRHKLTGLKPDTWYNFRALIETENPDEVFDGLVLSFRTPKYDGVGPGPTGGSGGFGGDSGGSNTGGGGSGSDDCGEGYTGTPPNCVAVSEFTCSDGIQNGDETGIDTGGHCDGSNGNCKDGIQNGDETGIDTGGHCPAAPGPTGTCPPGSIGIYPTCFKVPGIKNTCADFGMTGTYPKCEGPVQTCADFGMVGPDLDHCTYPPKTCEEQGMVTITQKPQKCGVKPLTCVEMGMTGEDPNNCQNQTYTCEELGMMTITEKPPKCGYPPPSCADRGLVGNDPENCEYPPSCYDGIKNGDETGIDTGGHCGNTFTCFDGIQNGDETGVDIGGHCGAGFNQTCENYGMTGTWPNGCKTPILTCQQMGLVGIWPLCIDLGNPGSPNGPGGDDGNQGDDSSNGPGGPGSPNGPGGSNGGNLCNNPNDLDCGGIPNGEDSDIDGDGLPNIEDADTDGDGLPNPVDPDDDADGIPDLVDNSPTGLGNIHDYDGSGIPNRLDDDMDGDGIPNDCDPDTDGDGLLNITDLDDDNDGLPDRFDPTPTGVSSGKCQVLGVGDVAYPDADDIVRYREGVETVFIRKIIRNVNLQKRYSFYGSELNDLIYFSYDLAHAFAIRFGYVGEDGREIRVSKPDVSAYSLRISGNKVYVYEFYKNKLIDIRTTRNEVRIIKTKNPYEYYFKKKF